MKVLTLSQTEFTNKINLFTKQIFIKFEPELILFIENGGLFIKQIIETNYLDLNFDSVKLQRSSTKAKNYFISKLLFSFIKFMPYKILDILRNIEHFVMINSSKQNFKKTNFISKKYNFSKILIIDDAIDTGTTMNSIFQEISRMNPDSIVKTAAFVVTNPKCKFNVDFIFYKNVLIRFPWSNDYKY